MRRVELVLTACLLITVQALEAAPQEPPAVPAAVLAAMSEKFPGYRLAQPADFGETSFQGPSRAVVQGDFDGNGLVDTAVVLVGADGWQVVPFIQEPAGTFTGTAVEHFVGSDAEFRRRVPVTGLHVETLIKGQSLRAQGRDLPDTAQDNDTLVIRVPAESQILSVRYSAVLKGFATDVIDLRSDDPGHDDLPVSPSPGRPPAQR